MSHEKLFDTYDMGQMTLKNRLVMAPMTRSRAPGNVPSEIMARYYSDRASAGLIITEGTSPSPSGLGYARIPGIFSKEQVDGWRAITDAVHEAGGKIFVQLMHTGRVGHPLNLPKGARVMGPSAVAAPGQMYTDAEGMKDLPVPEEMSAVDLREAIEEHADAAENAVEAGFDGVEIHGANGYLVDQFLNTASNHRTDRWGGSVENRARFALEVARAVSERIGPQRVGIRLSPAGGFNGMATDDDTANLYAHLAKELSALRIAYVHLVDHSAMGAPAPSEEVVGLIREAFDGPLIRSGGLDASRAEHLLVAGDCELTAFGRPFLANPDLVKRFMTGAELNAPDPNTFYTPGEEGYLDYPTT